MFTGWGPLADLFYGALVLLLKNLETRQLLTTEIRESFLNYEDILPGPKLTSLTYLDACIEGTLRMLLRNPTGLPRISPGATVDGQYISKGVSSNTILTNAASPGLLRSANKSTHKHIYSLEFGL